MAKAPCPSVTDWLTAVFYLGAGVAVVAALGLGYTLGLAASGSFYARRRWRWQEKTIMADLTAIKAALDRLETALAARQAQPDPSQPEADALAARVNALADQVQPPA